jgi:hypothetical protein
MNAIAMMKMKKVMTGNDDYYMYYNNFFYFLFDLPPYNSAQIDFIEII